MSAILIDYENVNGGGLIGLDLLKSTDSLIIFYSEQCFQLRKEHYDIIEKTVCEFSVCKLHTYGKDSLDKYIAVAVGELYQSGEKEISIISRDKGFQAVIDYFMVNEKTNSRILRAESIEQALLFFGNAADKQRRSIISNRCKMLDMDEISARLKERKLIQCKIKDALINTPYRYIIKDVCEFVADREDDSNRSLYTGAMHNFGRENGRALYNILKKVV